MLSPDVMLQAPDYSQSHNRYSYALNNPLKFTDPSGESIDWMNEAMGAYWEDNGIHSNAEARYNEWFEKGSNAVHDVNVNGKVVGTFSTMDEARETADMFKMGFILPDIEIKDVPTKGRALVQYTLDHLDDYAQSNGGDGDNWSSNAGTMAGMFMMWATGYRLPFGAGSYYKDDGVANAFRNAPGIALARKDYYATGKTSGRVPFGASGYWNAKNDPIETFVGTFDYQISVINNSLQFTITNRTSMSSFIPHPQGLYIWPESWNPTSGPFSNFNQTYIFTEPRRK